MALSGEFSYRPISGKQFGVVCRWSGAQNTVGNYTDITMDVYLAHGELYLRSITDNTYVIGNNSGNFTSPKISRSSRVPTETFLSTVRGRVYHSENGTASATLTASVHYNGTYGGHSFNYITASETVTLDSIARTAPSLNASASSNSMSSINISASSNEQCDTWQYSLDNGANWTTFKNESASSVSHTINGLSAGTTYSCIVRARSTSTGVYGTSGSASATTIASTVPTITFTSEQNNGVLQGNVYSSIPCHNWRYTLNGGTTWNVLQSTTASSVHFSFNVVGISSYNIQFKAVADMNGIEGTSNAVSGTVTVVTSVGNINSFEIEKTLYVPLKRNYSGGSDNVSVYLYNDGNIHLITNTWNPTYPTTEITFTDAQLADIYSRIGNNESASFQVIVTTHYSGGGLIGENRSNVFTGTSTSSAHIKANGTWKRAVPYIKVNGTWKRATAYTKNNGTWKRAI